MAMKGDLQDMAVADLIQHNCQERKTARLIVENNSQQAVLFFNEGTVQHATLGQTQGEEVVYEILTWPEGQFTLEMDVEPPAVTIQRSWSGLLLEGARRLDEAAQLQQSDSKDLTHEPHLRRQQMAKANKSNLDEVLTEIMDINGAMAAALVDWNSGMTLGKIGNGLNIDVAAAGNAEVVRAKFAVMKDLDLGDKIEDILITLGEQYHLIRPLASNSNLFIYVAFNKAQANLGMARYRLAEAEKNLVI